MTAVAFGLTSCSSGLVPKSKLLHNSEAQYGFVPTLGALRRLTLQELSHHGGKNTALRAEKPYLAMHSFFSEAVFSKYGARSHFFSGSSLPLKMFNVA